MLTPGAFLLVPILAEAVVDWAKDLLADKRARWQKVLCAAVCIVPAFTLKLDFFVLIGLDRVPILGSIFAGIVFSRGANYTNDLWRRIKEL